MTERIVNADRVEDLISVFGSFDENIRRIEDALNVSIINRGTDLKVSGIRHVAAVSGLHVTILFSLVYVLTGRRKWLAALLGFPVLVLFALVAGFSPSIVRACVMLGLMILAMLLNRAYDGPSALSFAVLILLLINPWSITDVSFQLSVCSLTGLFFRWKGFSNI